MMLYWKHVIKWLLKDLSTHTQPLDFLNQIGFFFFFVKGVEEYLINLISDEDS